MKTSQLVVLFVALVVVVFVATFASQWVGKPREATPQKVDVPASPKQDVVLTFPTTLWPPLDPAGAPTLPLIQERGIPGHKDFWFANNNDVAVTLGLGQKNCTCTNVQVALAPEDWEKRQGKDAATAVTQAALGGAGPLAVLAPAAGAPTPPDSDLSWRALESELANPAAKGFDIPARRGGWVRLAWKGDKAGDQALEAKMWMQTPASGVSETLRIGVKFVEPIRVLPDTRERTFDIIKPGDKPKETAFTILSVTRRSFSLVPESDADQKTRHPFVTLGKPVLLTGEHLDKLQESLRVPALSAYSIPVTVREEIQEGDKVRQIDMGPFRATLKMTSDVGDDPVIFFVTGFVEGDVTVVGDTSTRDRVQLETFSGRSGTTRTVALESDPTVKLTVAQKPDFMTVDLKEGASASGRKTWAMTLTIAPDAVSGAFPRTDDALLRDTAIYLNSKKTASDLGRRVRIPVSGTASQR